MNPVFYNVFSFLLSLVGFFFLARFILQVCRADFYNPMSQGIIQITDPILKPLRKIIPGFKNLDFSAFAVCWMSQSALVYVEGHPLYAASAIRIGAFGLLKTLLLFVTIYWGAIIIMIIASFVAQGSRHPFLALINQVVDPVLSPARRILPPMGGLDFSPILVFLGIIVLQSLLPQIFHALFL